MKINQRNWLSRVGIVVIAAVLVELISIVQYQRIRSVMEEEISTRSRAAIVSLQAEIGHMLELTETTMKENLWQIQRSLSHPDSLFPAMRYLIDDNPNVVGGCLAFVPNYYPSKGRIFEPYSSKKDGVISVVQLAGPDHDYTQNAEFWEVAESGKPDWSDPYLYGTDSTMMSLTTYSYPVFDEKGKLAAVCGLDMDLTWLGDTLNARPPYPSSFVIMLTQDNVVVATPSSSRISQAQIDDALSLIQDGKMESADGKTVIVLSQMERDPYWKLAQVSRTDELFAQVRRMRWRQIPLILLGLAILFFMINRFARNEKKLREASAEQARISGELEVARSIQKEMLPKSFPEGIYGVLEPAREVGGDLFDFYRRDGKLFFCIGDVSGKGVPSAMLMSVVHSLFRSVSARVESPSQIMQALNAQICEGNDSNMFATFFIGCLDLYTGRLHYVNAGHDKPFLLDASASLLAVKSNLPLGVFADTEFVEQAMTLSPGSGLFLYTDGVTEAKDGNRQAFGRSRVEEALNAHLADTPQGIVNALNEAVHGFAGDAPQSDDLTMLMIRFEPGDVLREELTIINEREEVNRLSEFVKGFLGKIEMDRRTASGLRLALEEAVVNVINYAYPAGEKGSVSIYADSNRREVRFTVVDTGSPFDPTAVLSADTTLDVQHRPIGNLGILLSRKLMDSTSYCRKGIYNVLTLTKNIV
ncbi:MAG: SpoIIE family protein phosphatase [Bacteroidales bacterium]|nr:SpoIIE family protein phosphatase [Bacteroidales bacterium]